MIFLKKSLLLFLYIYPASLFNDESGFGSSNNDIIDNNKILTDIVGDQFSFNIFKHTFPES